MSWIKLFLGLVTIGFCVLLGYLAAGKYRARKAFYTQLAAFNGRYLNELSYSRRPLADFLTQFSYTGDFGVAVETFSRERVVKGELAFLKKEERSYLQDYFGMLGKGDVRSQSGFFSAQSDALNAKKTESEKEAKTRGELYVKLGLLAGLAFVILII